MSGPTLRAWSCLLALVLLPLIPSGGNLRAAEKSEPLSVFAAASLKESLDEAATAYQKASGQAVRVSYAASSALARQIEQGAPADVFLSADLEWMDYLQQRKLIDPAIRRNLLGNTLVLVAPASGNIAPVPLKPGVDLLPRLGKKGRIALGMTASVPAGKYAKASFTSLGVWKSLEPRVAEAESVRAALMLVARGEAPLGVVYGSDAKAEPKVKVVGIFPENTHAPIVYPVARIAASRNPRAAAFVRWLATPAASKIFRARGFNVL
jgi:molybdate transport system substrate-binding protein